MRRRIRRPPARSCNPNISGALGYADLIALRVRRFRTLALPSDAPYLQSPQTISSMRRPLSPHWNLQPRSPATNDKTTSTRCKAAGRPLHYVRCVGTKPPAAVAGPAIEMEIEMATATALKPSGTEAASGAEQRLLSIRGNAERRGTGDRQEGARLHGDQGRADHQQILGRGLRSRSS